MDNSTARYRLGDISGPAFAAAAALNPVILLPLGSHEDHGPSLPMGDYLLAEALALRIAAAANVAIPVFVAPALPYGAADYFGSSPGGMAISPASFRAILHDLLGCLHRHGLSRIIILNGHGGNVPIIHEVTLAYRRASNIIIPSVYLWKIARQLMAARLGPAAADRFGHGAEPLLSLSLALRPDTTEAKRPNPVSANLLGLPVTGFGSIDFETISIDVPAEFDQVPREAAAAALPFASAELGALVAADLVQCTAAFITHFAAQT